LKEVTPLANHKYFNRICIIMSVVIILVALIYSYFGTTLGVTQNSGDLSYTTKLFDSSSVHSIDIEISTDDWNAIQNNAAAKDYQLCTLTIDGETVQNVAIRAKGNSSLSGVSSSDSERYSFKVEFDHYNDGESYHGLDKLNLNNIIQDNTYLKDYLCYDMMRTMGIATPLTSFTRISVNGEYFGLYLAVEGVEDAFAARNYGSDTGNIYKPDSMENNVTGQKGNDTAGNPGQTAGNDTDKPAPLQTANAATTPDATTQATATMPDPLATQGTETSQLPDLAGIMGKNSSTDVALIYSDDQISSYANIFDNPVTDVTTADKKRLIESIKQLNAGENLDQVVDVDEVLKYFVVHSFVDNFDSYTGSMMHNYYLREVNGQLSVIPWDYNLAFTNFSGGGMGGQTTTATISTVDEATTLVNFPIDTPVSGTTMANRPLLNALLSNPDYLTMYHQYYQDFISSYFDSGHYAEVIDKASTLISDSVATDPTAFCTYQEYQDGVAVLKEFCALRAESISGQLDGTIPATSTGQAEQPTTLLDASSLNISAMGSNTFGGGMNHQSFTNPAIPTTTSTENTSNNTTMPNAASQAPAMNTSSTGTEANSSQPRAMNTSGSQTGTSPPNGNGNPPATTKTAPSTTAANSTQTTASTAGETATTTTDNTGAAKTDSNTTTAQKPDLANRADQTNGSPTNTASLSQNLPALILLGGSILLLGVGLLTTKWFKR
jgi:spore coat protein CotH